MTTYLFKKLADIFEVTTSDKRTSSVCSWEHRRTIVGILLLDGRAVKQNDWAYQKVRGVRLRGNWRLLLHKYFFPFRQQFSTRRSTGYCLAASLNSSNGCPFASTVKSQSHGHLRLTAIGRRARLEGRQPHATAYGVCLASGASRTFFSLQVAPVRSIPGRSRDSHPDNFQGNLAAESDSTSLGAKDHRQKK